jgi:hypothetical protein
MQKRLFARFLTAFLAFKIFRQSQLVKSIYTTILYHQAYWVEDRIEIEMSYDTVKAHVRGIKVKSSEGLALG